jgi:hypothetical protein
MDFPVPGRDVTKLSLVSDIPAWDGEIVYLFYSVNSYLVCE